MTFMTRAQLRHDTVQARDYARKALENARKDAGHRLIWGLFAESPNAKRDFLFRTSGDGDFLIVSQRKPIFDEQVWNIRTRPYDPPLTPGERYGFSLKVSPTIALSQPDRGRSKHVDVVMHAQKSRNVKLCAEEREAIILDWLAERLEKYGAALSKNLCLVKEYSQIHIDRKGKDKRAVIAKASIDGVLTVTNPDLLKPLLFGGVGRGKAFGLGLLTLRPLANEPEDIDE